jgi:hypothetical protein
MTYLLALLIFLVINTGIWFVAVAVYRSLLAGPDLRHSPTFAGASTVSITLVTLISPVPFPAGYLLSLGVWALAAWGMMELSRPRAGVLFVLLAALSFISRLAILVASGRHPLGKVAHCRGRRLDHSLSGWWSPVRRLPLARRQRQRAANPSPAQATAPSRRAQISDR